MGKALPGWKEAEPLQSFAALREAFEKLPVTDRCRRLVISEQDALGMCHAAGREVEAREEAERQLQVTSDKLEKAEVKLARSEDQLQVTSDKLEKAEAKLARLSYWLRRVQADVTAGEMHLATAQRLARMAMAILEGRDRHLSPDT